MNSVGLDLDPESRRALQYDDLLEAVAVHARSALGVSAVRATVPLADAGAVDREIAAVDETVRHIDRDGTLVPGGLPDPRPHLELLAIAGGSLRPEALRDLAAVLLAAADLREQLLAGGEEAATALADLGRRTPDLRRESRVILGNIDPEGRVADEASPELGRLRQAQSRLSARLHGLLTRMVRDPSAEAVIQDDFITQRNGRYVIPVRTDSPRPVPGIMHAASSSGATRFVEPLESVEMNNELTRLAEEEREELERILRAWSDSLRVRIDDVRRAFAAVTVADAWQARSLFGREVGGVLPSVVPAGRLRLVGVRHPLLDRRLREGGDGAEPLDLVLDPADQVLVVSGPNTGGKTVALKTVGLAVLMAQSAIPIPGRTIELPLYRQVRADVGDHQSIDADLSTFSAHICAVKGFLEDATSPGLFLFDEIGTGTDPGEGAALAQAVLERLQRRGLTTVATTHQEALKAWAVTTDGAQTAAMEFDPDSLQPTYRVKMGAAGESAGLAIAERLGLDRDVVARARARLGPHNDLTRRYVDKLRELTADLESRQAELDERHAALEIDRERWTDRAQRADAARAKEAAAALEKALESFRVAARREILSVQDPKARAALERRTARADRRLTAERTRLEREVAPTPDPDRPAGWTRPTSAADLTPGRPVFVVSLGREGRVGAIERADRRSAGRAEVVLGAMTFTVELDDLRIAPPGTAGVQELAARGAAAAAPFVERPESPSEVKLLGLMVDEGLEALDRFLDAAALAGHEFVRVVHGHGTGRLRQAVRRHLRSHALVAELRPGRPDEGGDGATVARMK